MSTTTQPMDEEPSLESDRDEYRRRAMDVGARIERDAQTMTDDEFLQASQELAFNMREAVLRDVEIIEQRKKDSTQ